MIKKPNTFNTNIVAQSSPEDRASAGNELKIIFPNVHLQPSRLVRIYHDVLARGDAALPALADDELWAAREMLLEMWDSFSLMQVGNLIIVIDEELARRGAAPSQQDETKCTEELKMRDSGTASARARSVTSQSDVKAFVTGLLTELSTLCRDVLQVEVEDLQPECWKVGSERPTECTICGQLLAHRGEDWWDLCPTCADRVSHYMDEHNLGGKTGRAEAIRRVRETMARVFEQYRRAPAKAKWMLVIETEHPAEYSGPRITFHDSRAGADYRTARGRNPIIVGGGTEPWHPDECRTAKDGLDVLGR